VHDLPDDERMRENLVVEQQLDEFRMPRRRWSMRTEVSTSVMRFRSGVWESVADSR